MKIIGRNTKTFHHAIWDIKPDTRMFNQQEYEALARGETIIKGETVFNRTNALARAVEEIGLLVHSIPFLYWIIAGSFVLFFLFSLIK